MSYLDFWKSSIFSMKSLIFISAFWRTIRLFDSSFFYFCSVVDNDTHVPFAESFSGHPSAMYHPFNLELVTLVLRRVKEARLLTRNRVRRNLHVVVLRSPYQELSLLLQVRVHEHVRRLVRLHTASVELHHYERQLVIAQLLQLIVQLPAALLLIFCQLFSYWGWVQLYLLL